MEVCIGKARIRVIKIDPHLKGNPLFCNALILQTNLNQMCIRRKISNKPDFSFIFR